MRITVGDRFTHVPISHLNLVHLEQGDLDKFFDKAFRAGDLSESQILHRPLIFTTLNEGHGTREYQYVYRHMSRFPWFRPDQTCVLHNTCDTFPCYILNVSWSWHMVNHEDWFRHLESLSVPWHTIPRDKDILCLMRRPSARRKQCLDMLERYFSPSRLSVSYASQSEHHHDQRLIDGIIDRHSIAHSQSDMRFFQPLINLIVESGHQEQDKNLWASKFISEKTFKCFGWHQIPIWWTVPDFVTHVRELDFDVFDDVMNNHDYDSIHDPDERLDSIAQTLKLAVETINQFGREQWIQQALPRFAHNFVRLRRLVNNKETYQQDIYEQIKQRLVRQP